MRSTSIKRVGVNVFGLGHGSSWFGFLKQFFDRPSRKDVEAMIKKLAAEKDRVHMEDLAKAGKSFKVRPTLHCETLFLTRNVDQARS